MTRLLRIIGALLAGYLLSYVIFRNTNIQTWEKDGIEYVIFPKDQVWVYYLYRPLTYIDSKVTPMRFHIGPHQ